MAGPRGAEKGVREGPLSRRVGKDFDAFRGAQSKFDPSTIPAQAFQAAINARLSDGILINRGGQEKVISTPIPGVWDGLYDAGGLSAGLSLYMAGLALEMYGDKAAPDLTLAAGVYYVPASFHHAADDTRYIFLLQKTKPYAGESNIIYAGEPIGRPAVVAPAYKGIGVASALESNVEFPLSAKLCAYLGLTETGVPGVITSQPFCMLADNGTAYVGIKVTGATRLYSVSSGGWTLAKTFTEVSPPLMLIRMMKLSSTYIITWGTAASAKNEIWTAPAFGSATDFGTIAQTGFARQFFAGGPFGGGAETSRPSGVATSGGALWVPGHTNQVSRIAAVLVYDGATQTVSEIPVPGTPIDSCAIRTFLIGATVFAQYSYTEDGSQYIDGFASWNGSAWVDVGPVPVGASGNPVANGWVGIGDYAYGLVSDSASYQTALIRTADGLTFSSYGPQFSGFSYENGPVDDADTFVV